MTDYELSRLLISILVILSFALIIGRIFEKIGLPRVIGEISSGLLLGPTMLGSIIPIAYREVFQSFDGQEKLLSVFYWLGLILLMFSAGFKITLSFSKIDRGLVWRLVVGGITLPFILGFSASLWIPNGQSSNSIAFSLVIAIAASVTSIPVLTKIFFDLGIASSRFARLVLTASAAQDLILWTVLSIALAFQNEADIDIIGLSKHITGTLAFTAFAILATPPIIKFFGSLIVPLATDDELIGYALLVCIFLTCAASLLKVNVVFSALLAGLVIGNFRSSQMETVRRAISNVTGSFFVPIYFALVGFAINMQRDFDPILFLAFLGASSFVKVISVMLAIRTVATNWAESIDFAFTMNARGGPGIVLASIAYGAKIIDEKIFVTFILTSIITSLFAGVWLRIRLGHRTHSLF